MEVGCEFKSTSYGRSDYRMEVTAVKITQPNTWITSFKGDHEKGKGNEDVTWLSFRDVTVEYFPKGLSKHFPSLEELWIYNSQLRKITREDLKGLGNLRKLHICHCPLSSLPDDLFVDLTKLTWIELRANKIGVIKSKLLAPFIGRSMEMLDLQKNSSIDEYYLGSYGSGSVGTLEELMKQIDKKCKTPAKKKFTRHKMDFTSKLKSLWSTGRFSDFEIVAGSRTFKVHKNVLGLQSSTLAKIFDENVQATEMKIPDFSESSVENLLHFMYTVEVQENETLTSQMEMLSIATKLDVPELKEIYEKILRKVLKYCDDMEVYEIFVTAHRNSCKDLKRRAFEIFEKRLSKSLSKDLMNNPDRLKYLVGKKIEFDELFKK